MNECPTHIKSALITETIDRLQTTHSVLETTRGPSGDFDMLQPNPPESPWWIWLGRRWSRSYEKHPKLKTQLLILLDKDYMINVLKAWELMRKQWLGNIVKQGKVRIKWCQMQIKEPWKQQTNPQMIFNLLPPSCSGYKPVLRIIRWHKPLAFFSEKQQYNVPKIIPTVIFAEANSSDMQILKWRE